MKICKEFGVVSKGCEKKALQLFVKIDSLKQASIENSAAMTIATPKIKSSKELNSLDIGNTFKSNGTRSRGI